MRCRNSRFYTRGTSRRKTRAFILFKSHAFVYPRGYVLREERVARFGLARAPLPGDCSPSAISQPELRKSTFGDIPGQSIVAHVAIV